jgi:UDP-glucose 4-epimerase
MKIKKKVIVTGGSGFLGKNVIKAILRKNNIISIDKKKIKTNEKFIQIKTNLRNYFKNKDLKNVSCIIHLATSDSRANFYKKSPNLAKKNIDDLICILEKIKKQKNKILLIFASSRDVENKYDPNKSLYAFSKEYSENLIKQYALNSNFIFYIIRIPDLFEYKVDNNPKSKALYKIVENLNKSKNIFIDNSEHIFEYITTEKVSTIVANILKKKINKNTILSLKGEKINIVKLIKTIAKLKLSNSNIIIKKKIMKKNYIEKINRNKNNNFFKKLMLN